MNTRTSAASIAIGLAGLLFGVCWAAGQKTDTKQPEVNERVLAFIKPVEIADADDELTKKLKERHNVAASLLDARVQAYNSGVSDLSQVLESGRMVADSKYDLAQDDNARLAVLDETLEIAKLIESHQQAKSDANIGSRSYFQRARLARLNIEVQILKLKRGIVPKP